MQLKAELRKTFLKVAMINIFVFTMDHMTTCMVEGLS